jgi:hypothetical protein
VASVSVLAPDMADGTDELDASALIEAARRRQRRRRRTLAAVTLLVVAGVVAFGAAGSGTNPARPTLVHVPGAPRFTVVDATALRGHADVAFVSLGQLFVVESSSDRVAALTAANAGASNPQFSPKGRWLVYETDFGARSWLARSSGIDRRRLGGSAVWLANGQLSVTGATQRVTYSISASGALARVGASAPANSVATGGSLAVFITDSLDVHPPATSNGFERLETATSASGPRTVWYSTKVRFDPRGGLQGDFLGKVIALPGEAGLLLTIEPYCCDYADGYDLYELRAPGGAPASLGMVLGGADDPSFGPNGTFAFERGGDRYAWVNKHVVVCTDATARCVAVATPPKTLSVSPAWSPNGKTLAFVEAKAEGEGAIGQPQIAAWYASHHLFFTARASSRPSEVPDTAGATQPTWSSDSKSLMFVKNDALFLIAHLGSSPVEIAGPLFTPGGWGGYYGELDWGAQFAWSAS